MNTTNSTGTNGNTAPGNMGNLSWEKSYTASATIKSLSYDANLQRLTTIFTSGKGYVYKAVPADVAVQLQSETGSIGRAFNRLIGNAGFSFDTIKG